MDGVLRPLVMGALVAFAIGALASWSPSSAQDAEPSFDPAVRPEFREPVVLASKDGVLEVTLTAHQGVAHLDTVAVPVKNFLVFAYEVTQGTASNGKVSDDNLYPAPTLQVFPGETLIVHLDNALSGLTIRDLIDPKYIPKGEEVPLYPDQLTSSPINLHIHGVHVSPKGNADNVMLHIPAGESNTYTYRIPKSMPQGAYWYHSHLHTLTTAHTYLGLAGLLAIGRTDGNLPLVTDNSIPIRNMVLQYNYVFDRAGGLAEINNYSWPQWLSTLKPPVGDELAKGTYRPLLTPANFLQSRKGDQFFTIWYAGPLSIYNQRGRFQFIPSNLQRFTAFAGQGKDVPADPSLPDYKRDVQFTVNGQFEPVIKSKAGQTEIWVLANISDIVYMPVQLTETATGNHPKIAVVGQDGLPVPEVHYPVLDNGTKLLIPPATRYAIAVTMPDKGDLVLDMPPRGGGAVTTTAPGILYTNDGTDNPPATLGNISVLPSAVSYYDGFFFSPTQVLARATTDGGQGVTTTFAEGQKLDGYTPFRDISQVTPDFKRDLVINGGFLNDLASKSDPKTFIYAFAGMAFPNVALIQPRLGSIEEWNFINYNNDEHPIHIHVNDFQVTHYFDPTTGLETGPEMWGVDNANVPAPVMGAEESVIQSGALSLRMSFDDFTGLFVMHCHRLNHEDNGLMALVNVIPAVSTYAVAVPGAQGRTAEVKVYDGNGDKLLATVNPFPGYEGNVSAAMGDVDGDGVYDLVVGAGKDHAPEIVAYSGKNVGKGAFATELARFEAFPNQARGGVNVTVSSIDGSTSDNIIVGSPPGTPSEVKVFRTALPTPGAAPELFASFNPYPNDQSGVTVSSGFVDFITGRNSIVTAPGPGVPTQVKVFAFTLMSPIGQKPTSATASKDICPAPGDPALTAAFMPFGSDYRGGVSLATGWLTGSIGGAKRIVVGQLTGPGTVKVFSSGSALQGGPATYLYSAMTHELISEFTEAASLQPFGGDTGVRVATTSTTIGADLLVSGFSQEDNATQVRKYQFVRPTPDATMLDANQIAQVVSAADTAPYALGGD
ncbi:MAG TPA: multicopper oxidase domain-containing protein [Methyloceanibacter sp.]